MGTVMQTSGQENQTAVILRRNDFAGQSKYYHFLLKFVFVYPFLLRKKPESAPETTTDHVTSYDPDHSEGLVLLGSKPVVVYE
jgi:hypothetical protein